MNNTDAKMERPMARFDVDWNSDFTLRSPEENDIEVLTEMDHEGMTTEELGELPYPDSVKRFFDYISLDANLELSKQASCVVLADGEIIAFCLFVAEKLEEAHLYNIHVAIPYRRRGIATKMIQRGLTLLADNYNKINLDTPRESVCVSVFKKLGFEET